MISFTIIPDKSMRLNEILNRPYYNNTNLGFRFVQAVLFGVFVSLFLIVFQPFQISGLGQNWWLKAIGFGGVTLVVMVVLNVIIPVFFKKYFEAEKWTVKKEILHSSLNLIGIGFVNGSYFIYLVVGHFSLDVFLTFQFFTICVGLMPIVILALYRERKDYNRFSLLSQSINSDFQAKSPVKIDVHEQPIQIRSKNKDENITLQAAAVLVIKAMDNYLEVYTIQGKEIVRNTLKSIEHDLKQHPHFFRCHKSYVVNLDKVSSISGNAQGYKLVVENYENEIPVSRSLNEEIKSRLLSLTS